MAKKINCIVSKIQKFDTGTYLVELTPNSSIPKYKPGQFLHLTIDDFDPTGGYWPESRVFSICSQFSEKQITILYSVKGSYTKRMEESLSIGQEVWIKLPFGEFVIDCNPTESVFLIAGGTGISPFIPFLKTIGDDFIGESVNLFYGVRNLNQLIFKTLLDDLMKGSRKLLVKYFSEESNGNDIIHGKIDPNQILEYSRNVTNSRYYLSGPPGMIAYFKNYLLENKINAESIFIDSWE